MKYFILVGEKSGDIHASRVASQLYKLDKNAEIVGWGGDEMQQAGVKILKHFAEFSVMGFFEVLKKSFFYLNLAKECKNNIREFNPDAILFVDFSGFNLKIAQWAKKQHFRNFYYIAPKTWAWNTKRTLKIKRSIEHLFVIFPFEVPFFSSYQIRTTYVGNPIVEHLEEKTSLESTKNLGFPKPIIALLPGSRRQEIEAILPITSTLPIYFTDYQFVIAGISEFSIEFYENLSVEKLPILYHQTENILQNSVAAIVTSGTATLETALLEVPQVVVYKTNLLNYLIARAVVKIKYISLVNLIAEKEIVKELIQNDCNTVKLKQELELILKSNSQILDDYKTLKQKIGKSATSVSATSVSATSLKVASIIVQELKENL